MKLIEKLQLQNAIDFTWKMSTLSTTSPKKLPEKNIKNYNILISNVEVMLAIMNTFDPHLKCEHVSSVPSLEWRSRKKPVIYFIWSSNGRGVTLARTFTMRGDGDGARDACSAMHDL